MNYLDFSHKIMLYLQLRGILFKFTVNTSADLSCVIENKNGMPFDVEVAEKSTVDVSAINGDGIIARVENINDKGEVNIRFIGATAELARIEGIEEKAEMIASAAIGQAIKAALAVREKASMRVMFEPFGAIPFNIKASENEANISVLIEQANAILSGVSVDEEANAKFEMILVTATLLSIAISEKSKIAIEAANGIGVDRAVAVKEKANVSAIIKLLIEAVIADYEDFTLEEMGDYTLEELSKKSI